MIKKIMKKRIEFLPTKIIIHDYEIESCKKLENSLSVYNPIYFRYDFRAFFYDENKKELIIPGSFNKDYLKKLLPDYHFINKKFNTNPFKEVKFSLKFPPRNDLQKEAIKQLIRTKNTQKYLVLETGAGKTYCAINYVFHTHKLPILFVDQEKILNQWIDRIKYFTDITDKQIYVIKGKHSIEKLLKMTNKELSNFKWFVSIHRTINSYMNENDKFEKLDILFSKLGIGLKIFDEAHVEYESIFYIDSMTNTESLYLSATPDRSNKNENKVYQNMFKYCSFINITSNDKYHNVIICKYNTNPSIEKEIEFKTKYGFDANKWCNYILHTEKYDYYFKILTNLIRTFYKKNKKFNHKIAIVFHTLDGISILYNDFKNEFPELTIGRLDSSIKTKEEKEIECNKNIFFTTDKSFGKAMDIKDLDIIINSVPFSSKVVTRQMMGRLRKLKDKKVFFIDLVDIGFTSCKNQLKQKKIIYNKDAKNIYEINM